MALFRSELASILPLSGQEMGSLMGQILAAFLTLILVVSAKAEPAISISSAPMCEGENQTSVPFMRLGLSAFAFENQVLKILTNQVPKIQDTVTSMNLQDLTVGGARGACPKYKAEPGMDQETLCLYLPKIIFGESMNLFEFKKEIKESIGLRMNFDDIRIPEFELKNADMKCDFQEGEATCEISMDVPRLLVESQFDFVDPREDKKIFSTVSPAQLKVYAKDGLMPRISMTAKLRSNGKANEAIDIDKNSMKFVVPPETLSSVIQNNEDDALPRILEALEAELDLDPSLSEEERAQAALELLDSPRGTEIIETFSYSFGIISIAQGFIGDADVLAAFQEPLLEMVEEPLSIMLTDVIEKVLPFEKSVELTHPIPPMQDNMDKERYLVRFQEISDYLDGMERKFTNAGYSKARELRRDHAREIKNIGIFAERLQNTQLDIIAEELDLLQLKLQLHIEYLEELDKLSSSLRKRLNRALARVTESKEKVKNSEIPLYRKSQLHIDRVGRVSKDGLEALVAGCHVGGLVPNAPEGWNDTPMNKSALSDNHFSVEIPVTVVNQHLRLLHENRFYDYCSVKNKSCAERSGPGRTTYKLKKAPRIKMKDDKSYFEIPELQRTSYTFLPNFIDKSLFRESTRLKICLDGLVLRTGEDSIIPEDCIQANAIVEKNFRMEHLFTFLNPVLGLSFLGLKLTYAAFHQIILDTLENGLFRRSADDILLENKEYIVRELKVENGRLNIYGKIAPKSEQQ